MRALMPLLRRRWLRLVGLCCLLALALLVTADQAISRGARPYLFGTADAIPANEVGLVLGTSHRARGGGGNPYFNHRIAAALELYRAGKVRHLLLSGDNGTMSYNEPREMRRALMAAGVDSARITLDFAGFRTLDSVVRAKQVFGQQRFTVISQRFHNERAVYLARHLGIEAIGFDAPDPQAWWGPRVWLRERLARVKVFLDLIMGTQPRFLGEPVPLRIEQPAPDAADTGTARP